MFILFKDCLAQIAAAGTGDTCDKAFFKFSIHFLFYDISLKILFILTTQKNKITNITKNKNSQLQLVYWEINFVAKIP